MENTIIRFGCAFLFSIATSACGDVSIPATDESKSNVSGLSYRQESDDFAGAIRLLADGSFWIDEDRGTYLSLQFECLKSSNNDFEKKFTLYISSQVDLEKSKTASPEYIDAILFKINDGPAKIYRTSDSLPGFTQNSVDITEIMKSNGAEKIKKIAFRFVHGGSIRDSFNANVQELSQLPSIDVVLDSAELNAGEILSNCSTL